MESLFVIREEGNLAEVSLLSAWWLQDKDIIG